MKLVTIVGARPQFIKAAVVSNALAESGAIQECLVHTGQHYDNELSDIFFQELGLAPPDHTLGVGSGSQGEQTGRMLAAIEPVLQQEAPQGVLVYGDTNSTLAGALAAAKLNLPVAHVEAGLRSFDRSMPEEINRILTDHLSALLFAPMASAVDNLRREGIAGDHVIVTGDVMHDAVRRFARHAKQHNDNLTKPEGLAAGYVLATVHRAASTDNATTLATIFNALALVAVDIPVVLPLHPRTRAALQAADLLDQPRPGVQMIPPVGYLDMQRLTSAAALVVTDSGGLQKEAFYHHVPCVTLRGETEWTELVECGWNTLAPPTEAVAVATVISRTLAAGPPAPAPDIYGDGTAARRIARALQTWLC